jgi:hypothetical protein
VARSSVASSCRAMERPQAHSADDLAPRGERVDDPAGREDAEHAAHPYLAAGGIHGDLGELGPVGVPFLLFPLGEGDDGGGGVGPYGDALRRDGHAEGEPLAQVTLPLP